MDLHSVPGAGDRIEAGRENHQIEIVLLGGRLDSRRCEALDRCLRKIDQVHVLSVVGLEVARFEGKALRGEAPKNLRDIYEASVYARSQEYTRVETRFGFVTSTFDLVLLLVFWFSGGFPWLDATLRDFGFGALATASLRAKKTTLYLNK